jgi:hypothetical protein
LPFISSELYCWCLWPSPQRFWHDLYQSKRTQHRFLEEKLLNRLRPYVTVRIYTDRISGLEARTTEDLKPVLVRIYNGWQLGFLADAFDDGHVAVFMPGAPNPSSGMVQIISAEPHQASRYSLPRRTRVP